MLFPYGVFRVEFCSFFFADGLSTPLYTDCDVNLKYSRNHSFKVIVENGLEP